MNSNGFGFSFGFGNGDDDNEKNGNSGGQNNPFGMFFGPGFGGPGQGPGAGGPGGLGDLLNQFGQMLSGMGTSMNSQSGPINYEMVERIAKQRLQGAASVSAGDTKAVEESVRLVELWLDDATVLPASGEITRAWSATDYFSETLPMWKRLINPVAENMNSAQLESIPEEAREMLGPMANMMSQVSSVNLAVQVGNALGDLSSQALTGSDFGLPVTPRGVVAVLPLQAKQIAQQLRVEERDLILYLAAREAAHQRLFRHVPWLVERLVSSVEEYAAGLTIDTSAIEEATRDLNLESGDPAQIQEALSQLQGQDLSPTITSSNPNAATRLETLLALVEGWTDLVVAQALEERIPATSQIAEAWRRRRATGGSAEKAFARVVGIELSTPKVAEATALWRRVDNAVGQKTRDGVWDHPDFLPTADDIDSPAGFIDGLLDTESMADFDPIAEIRKLEEANQHVADDDPEEKGGSHGTS